MILLSLVLTELFSAHLESCLCNSFACVEAANLYFTAQRNARLSRGERVTRQRVKR